MNRNRTTLLTLLVASVALGCQRHPDVWAVHGADPARLAVVEDAMAIWCAATDGAHCASTSDDGDSNMFFVPASGLAETDDGLYTLDDAGGERIWLRLDLDLGRLRSVALHELGHSFGCRWHTSGDTDVMNTWADGVELTAADLECVR